MDHARWSLWDVKTSTRTPGVTSSLGVTEIFAST